MPSCNGGRDRRHLILPVLLASTHLLELTLLWAVPKHILREGGREVAARSVGALWDSLLHPGRDAQHLLRRRKPCTAILAEGERGSGQLSLWVLVQLPADLRLSPICSETQLQQWGAPVHCLLQKPPWWQIYLLVRLLALLLPRMSLEYG